MGASGVALLCEKGHQFFWLDDDLYWIEEVYKRVANAKSVGCPCGSKFTREYSHYGSGVNDCLKLEDHLQYCGEETFRSKFPIKAFTVDGDEILVYQDVTLPVYKKNLTPPAGE